MAKIVNLGSPGPQRESSMSGFASTFSAVSGARENRARTGIMQQEADTNVQQATNKANDLTLQLAEEERKKDKEAKEYTYKLLEDVSIAMSNKTPDEQEIFWTSDQGKSVGSVIKEYLPDYWSKEKGRPLTLQKSQIVSNKLDKIKLDIVTKMGTGAELSSGEMKQLDFFKQYSPQMIGAAVQAASNNLSWSAMDSKEQADAIRQQLTLMKQLRQGMFENEEGGSTPTPKPEGGVEGLMSQWQ